MMMNSRTASRLRVALGGVALVAASAASAADAPVEKVTVRAVTHFDFARTGIKPEDQAAILANVGKMTGVSWQSVTAIGHTDSVGRARANERLSVRRAAAVKSYLVGKGLDPAMIRTEGKAARAPLASNDTSDGRAQNRRTEVEFEGVRTAAR
jgi:OOP family OmpA-OmpF porin